jgi:large subunit ribosomal protein L21
MQASFAGAETPAPHSAVDTPARLTIVPRSRTRVLVRLAPVLVFDHLRTDRQRAILLVDGSLTMFAVIRTGGKQYRVAQDQLITVERLAGEPGASVTLDEVLMLGGEGAIQIGTPVLAGASVTAEVVEQTRGPKIIIFKKKRRQNYRRKKGHRQDLTVLKITAIAGA